MAAEETTAKAIGAKELSKGSMIFSTAWIGIFSVLKWTGIFPDTDITEVIYTAIAMVAMWSPTYISIILDKIKDIRFGK